MMMEMLMKTLAALISQRDHVARDCNCVRRVGVHASPQNAERERRAGAEHASAQPGSSRCQGSLDLAREGRAMADALARKRAD